MIVLKLTLVYFLGSLSHDGFCLQEFIFSLTEFSLNLLFFSGDHIYKPTLPMWIFFPKLVNKTVHKNYVDCAKFLSPQIVVSKSSENYLAAWIPDESRDDNTVKSSCITLFQYGLINCKIWFMKFALSPSTRRLLALGLQDGRVMILDLKADEDPTDLRVCFIKANNTAPVGAIRQVAFSLDSKLLVGVTQDGKVSSYYCLIEIRVLSLILFVLELGGSMHERT